MKRRVAPPLSAEIRTAAAAPQPEPTAEEPNTAAEEDTPSRPWDDPRWWQRVVGVGVLLVVLLLVSGLVLRPDIEKWVSQVVHPVVAVQRATPSPAPRRLPHVTTSLPVVQATPTATVLPVATTPTTAAAALPPAATAPATAVPGPATITITIECTASKTNPGFCEFLDGSTITTHDGASCSLTLGVWSYVGQQTEAVGCSEPHASDLSFVGAPVPCSTNGKGACAGDVASQQQP